MSRNTILQDSYSKVPPQSVDLEEAVIGALMVESASYYKVEFLTKEMFYKECNQYIYEAISQLHQESKPVDILTIQAKLTSNGTLELVGGIFYLMDTQSKVSVADHIESHARIIQQQFIKREVIRTSSEAITLAFDETTDALSVMELAEKSIVEISNSTVSGNESNTVTDLLKEIKKDVKKASKGEVVGLSTGLPSIDEYMTFEGGYIYLLAGRTGSGKTSVALAQMSKAVLDDKKHVMFASLEMPDKQLLRWMLLAYGAEQRTVKYGQFYEGDKEKYDKALSDVAKKNIHIGDSPKLTDIFALARKLKRDGKLDLLVVDYIQKIRIDGNMSVNDRLIYIMDEFKAFAKKYDIPILILSQMNRSVERREDKTPQLDDLRGSGGLEEGADIIMFILRGEYYDVDGSYTIDGQDVPVKGIMKLKVAKNKDGSTGEFFIRYTENLKSFSEYTQDSVSSFEDYDKSMQPNVDFQHEPREQEDFKF